MGYYIFDRRSRRTDDVPADGGTQDEAALESMLLVGTPVQQQVALHHLVARSAEAALVRCLATETQEVTRLAMDGLWECWLNENGPLARACIDRGIAAMNAGHLAEATEIFRQLSTEYPAWAEPVNKQATVAYLKGIPEQSIIFCQQTLALKPDHFGAWNGLALCAIQIEDWLLARQAVEQSLRLLPHSGYNQQLLKLVESRLPVD